LILYILEFLAIVILYTITYQDFISRAVSWIYFPILAVICFCMHIYSCSNLKTVCIDAFVNILFFICQLFGVFIYFLVKNKFKWIALSSKIGWGDILFLLACAFLFSFFQFIIFYVSSLLFSIAAYLIIYFRKMSKQETIPLAGLQSFYLSIWILLFVCGFNCFSYNEIWFNKILGYDY
jgi:hypothetical protein